MGPTCHGLQEQVPKLEKFLAAGMDRDQVRAAFVADAGSQGILMAPLDQGFNRLAWLFPYVIGAIGFAAAALVARRWSKRAEGTPAGGAEPPENTELGTRLDDELRDLD